LGASILAPSALDLTTPTLLNETKTGTPTFWNKVTPLGEGGSMEREILLPRSFLKVGAYAVSYPRVVQLETSIDGDRDPARGSAGSA